MPTQRSDSHVSIGAPSRSERWARLAPPILFALALALALKVILDSLPGIAREPLADDRFYLRYMQRVHEHGLGAFPALFDEWNADPQSWIYPPPSRVGFIVVSALAAAIFGATIDALQYLSIGSYVASSIVTYVFARRHFGEPRAVFIATLWAYSPLLTGLSRLALTDSFIALCLSLCAWLFLELVLDPTRWRWRILFMAMLAFTVLVKELTVLVCVPFAAFALVEKYWRREPLPLGVLAAAFVVPAVVVMPIFIAAAGGLPVLVETTRTVLASPATNAYAIKFGTGPWFRYVLDFLCLSPVATLLAVAFLGVTLLRARSGAYNRRLVFLALIAVCLLFEYSFFTKNVRYAVLFELPIRVFAVCMLTEVLRMRKPFHSALACGVAVALVCWFDVQYFQTYWVRNHGYDPVSWKLAATRELIPFPTPNR